MKSALILGITGQDGSYLADILLSRGYTVHGMVRHTSLDNLHRIKHLCGKISTYYGDMLDPLSVDRIIRDVRPREIYNLADQDNVDFSFRAPSYNVGVTTQAVVNLIESIRNIDTEIKLFQPVSATMFGLAPHPQNESSSFMPQSPYACCKLATYYLCQHYRREHGMFIATGIMYNHDSPRRSSKYLLHRIARQAVRIARGELGMMLVPVPDMLVDIGYAKEYMEVAHAMLQKDAPDDYVVATGWSVSIRELAETALLTLGVDESRINDLIQMDLAHLRPGLQPTLIGNATKMRQELGVALLHNTTSMMELLTQHTVDEMGRSCG